VSALVEHRAGSDDDGSVAARDTDVALADDAHPAPDEYSVPQPAVEQDAWPPDVVPGSGGHEEPVAPVDLRIDFGAHFESHYQRLVAQLYAITLDAGQAHEVVQDAYARAWRRWPTVGRGPDPAAWVRGVAVRSTIRSWRTLLGRFGIGRPRPGRDGNDPRTVAMLSALRRLPAPERRAIVLTYMAGSSIEEIGVIEQVSYNTMQARLSRGRRLITENLADDLSAVLGGMT
jgi:DNA-directed RNA polymerase specialized sigma24 family protein